MSEERKPVKRHTVRELVARIVKQLYGEIDWRLEKRKGRMEVVIPQEKVDQSEQRS